MRNADMLLSDVLTGYVNGKPVDSQLWQSLDEQTRTRHCVCQSKDSIGMIATPIQKQKPASSDQ
jgi:hypothetical protein